MSFFVTLKDNMFPLAFIFIGVVGGLFIRWVVKLVVIGQHYVILR